VGLQHRACEVEEQIRLHGGVVHELLTGRVVMWG
jgi:hypothetical protein